MFNISKYKPMKLNLRRFLYENDTTLGYLLVDGVPTLFTLEDKVREVKIPKQTAIPTGIYRIEIKQSPHFGRLMPYLVDVPNFTGVMIHSGNDKDDTEGCILVGQTINALGKIANSKIGFDSLFIQIQKAFEAKEDIFLSVEDYIRPL